MTIPSTARKAGPLLGNGSTTSFPFTFKVFAASDIQVTIVNSLGVETVLVLNTDYSVSLNGNQDTSPGGTVTYPISGSALPSGSKLSIIGNLGYDQPLDLPSGGNFSPLAIENQLDRATMQIQQLKEQLGRSLLLPVTASQSPSLPAPEGGQIIGWDPNGTNLQNYALDELATAVAFATYRNDTFTGTGSQTNFTLTADPVVLTNLQVSVDGLMLVPGTDYSVSGTTLTFTTAPTNGAEILARYGQGFTPGTVADANDVTFYPGGTGAVTRTAQSKLREVVSVKDFGAVGDGVTDDAAALQAACDAVYAAGGGTVYIPAGNYICNTPLRVQRNTNLRGAGRESTTITKDSTTTKAVTIVAGAGVVYPGTLPSNINAIIVLDGAGGRYVGSLSDFTIQGTLATPGDYESQKVDFGIVSIGSVSDSKIENVSVLTADFGWYFPDIFASTITNNRITQCLTGSGIENGTSVTYTSNYANNCRNAGHFIRAIKYSDISSNACDYLNDPAKYPTRTRTCSAYILRSLIGCSVTNNGDENTYGRSYSLITLDNCTVQGNTSIAIGSDYVGADEIAWIYSDGVLRCSRVVNNVGYTVKASGLLSGGAVAGQHHNIYFASTTYVNNSEVTGNMVRTSLTGAPVEAGWGNNVPTAWVNEAVGGEMVQTFSPTITANTIGNLSVTYNSGNKHYRHDLGNLYHVFGCFDVTITYTTASSFLIFQGFPANQSILWKIPITGVEGGAGLTKKLGSFRLNSGGGSGIAFDENDATFAITDIPTGTTLQIFYDGWYAKA